MAEEQTKALVPVTDFASTQFSHRVGLSREDLIESLKQRPDVHWYDDRPDPFPEDDAAFQAWAKGDLIFLRRMQELEGAKSPFVALRVEASGQAHLVHGAFVRRPIARKDGTQKILRITVLLMWLSLVGTLASALLGGIPNPVQLVGLLIAIPWGHHLLRLGEAPDQASMERHGRALRALVGEVLIPHELGEGDAPFRALPAGRIGD